MADDNIFEIFKQMTTKGKRTWAVTLPFAPAPDPKGDKKTGADIGIDYNKLGSGDFELLNTRLLPLDVRTARMVNSGDPVPGERNYKQSNLDYITTRLVNASLLPERTRLAVCRCLADGRIYRIDGKHTCKSVIDLVEAGGKLPKYTVAVDFYQAKTMEGLKALYTMLDRNASRTPGNVVETHLADTTDYHAFGKNIRARVAAGVSHYLRVTQKTQTRTNPDKIADLMLGELREASLQACAILSGSTKKEYEHVARAGVVAAMLATYAKNPTLSYQFWTVVRDGTGVNVTADPRGRLRAKLTGYKVHSENNQNFELYRYAVTAWNAWRSGKGLSADWKLPKQFSIPDAL